MQNRPIMYVRIKVTNIRHHRIQQTWTKMNLLSFQIFPCWKLFLSILAKRTSLKKTEWIYHSVFYLFGLLLVFLLYLISISIEWGLASSLFKIVIVKIPFSNRAEILAGSNVSPNSKDLLNEECFNSLLIYLTSRSV